jgi:hypothetical protein
VPVSQNHSAPDVADRHRRLLAYAVLAVGARYATRVAAYFVGPELASPLGFVADGFALVAVGLIVPIFIWKMRNASRADWHLYKDENGFVARNIARAQSASWVATFLVLVLLEAVGTLSETLPTALFFDALLAMMSFTFSGAYFYLDRSPVAEPRS